MYNFDEIIDRTHTNALNTDGFRGYIFHAGPEKKFPYADDEFVRMWVADMEFAVAPEICDAMKARIDRRIFGYTGVYDDDYYQSFAKWCRDHYDWDVPKDDLSSFTFIKRLFSSSLSAIRVVSSAHLRLLIFLPSILIPACASSSPAFLMMYSAYKLNKQGDNMQP